MCTSRGCMESHLVHCAEVDGFNNAGSGMSAELRRSREALKLTRSLHYPAIWGPSYEKHQLWPTTHVIGNPRPKCRPHGAAGSVNLGFIWNE